MEGGTAFGMQLCSALLVCRQRPTFALLCHCPASPRLRRRRLVILLSVPRQKGAAVGWKGLPPQAGDSGDSNTSCRQTDKGNSLACFLTE